MRAAVVGLGNMGPGIAATLARGGIDAVCYDAKPERRERARREMPVLFETLHSIGDRVLPKQGEIRFSDDLGGSVRDVDIVIEAMPERVEIKHTIFAALDRLAPAAAILASTTAGISITRLQEACVHKGRVLGMRWSHPPHVMPLVEVIAGEHTDPATMATVRAIATNLGLTPVEVRRDVPGFVHNRLLYALLRESLALIEKGVIAPEELDRCVKAGLGLELAVSGPMELLDSIGLDQYQALAGVLNSDLEAGSGVAGFVASRSATGALGMKAGSGVYRYSVEQVAALRSERSAKRIAMRKLLASSSHD